VHHFLAHVLGDAVVVTASHADSANCCLSFANRRSRALVSHALACFGRALCLRSTASHALAGRDAFLLLLLVSACRCTTAFRVHVSAGAAGRSFIPFDARGKLCHHGSVTVHPLVTPHLASGNDRCSAAQAGGRCKPQVLPGSLLCSHKATSRLAADPCGCQQAPALRPPQGQGRCCPGPQELQGCGGPVRSATQLHAHPHPWLMAAAQHTVLQVSCGRRSQHT